MHELTFMTLNVRSVRSQYKWAQLSLFVNKHNPDILLIQEANTDYPTMRSLQNYTFYFSTPVIPYKGVAFAIKNNIRISSLSTEVIFPSHALGLCMTITYPERHTFLLVTYYGPHDQDSAVELVHEVNRYIEAAFSQSRNQNIWVVIGGDFNCTMAPSIDRSSGTERHARYVGKLRQMINQHRLVDVWRRLNPNKPGFTHVYHRGVHTASRLDRFYMTDTRVQSVHEINIES